MREYYFNDAGAQIDRFTNSLIAAAKGEPTPDDGYAGDYIKEIGAQVLAEEPDALSLPDDEMRETFRVIGVDLMFSHIKQSLHDFGTDFDVYTHEDSMHTSGRVDHAIAKLREPARLRGGRRRLVARHRLRRRQGSRRGQGDTATSPRTSRITSTSASAVRPSSPFSAPTTTATSTGSGRCAVLGENPATVEVLIGQPVNLVRDGEAVRLSKRAGTSSRSTTWSRSASTPPGTR